MDTDIFLSDRAVFDKKVNRAVFDKEDSIIKNRKSQITIHSESTFDHKLRENWVAIYRSKGKLHIEIVPGSSVEDVKQVYENFNSTLRKGESKRVFVRCYRVKLEINLIRENA